MSEDMNAEQGGSMGRPEKAHRPQPIDQQGLQLATEGVLSGQNSLPEAQDTQGPLKDVNFTVTDGSVPGGPGIPTPPTDASHGERVPKKHTRRNILRVALGLAVTGGLATVGAGIGKKGGGDGPIVIANPATKVPTPVEPVEKTPTSKPDNDPTGVPKDTPTTDPDAGGKEAPSETETSTPEPATSTPDELSTATPEPDPSMTTETKAEVRAALEKYYLPLGEPINTYEDTTYAVAKEVQERDTICVPLSGEKKIDCRVSEVFANTQDFGQDAIDSANYETWHTLYRMWRNFREDKPESQLDLMTTQDSPQEEVDSAIEEFKRRVKEGEDLSFPVMGFGEEGLSTFTRELWVNPALGMSRVTLPKKENLTFVISTGGGVNLSVINGHLINGVYTSGSDGIIYAQHELDLFISKYELSNLIAFVGGVISDKGFYETLKNGRVNIATLSLADHKRIRVESDASFRRLIENYGEDQTTWKGKIRARQ